MKLRSRGLGRKELVMDFREYEITRDGDEVVVSGTIREPVNWDFTIRFSGEDIPGMLRVGLHRHTLAMAVRSVFRRGKRRPNRAEPRDLPDGRPVAEPVSPRAPKPEPRTEVVDSLDDGGERPSLGVTPADDASRVTGAPGRPGRPARP